MSVIRIAGTGSVVPPWVVTNDQLHSLYPGKGPGWILEKVGIEERRWGFDFASGQMREGWFDTDLAERAAHAALEMAGITAASLDLVVYVGCTLNDIYFHDSAVELRGRIGAPVQCGAYTTQGGCGGLVYAIRSVEGQIRSGQIKRALIVAANAPSSFVGQSNATLQTQSLLARYSDVVPADVAHNLGARLAEEIRKRDWLNLAIFGDGASALVLEGVDDHSDRGILSTWWGSDPNRDPMSYPGGGSRNPTMLGNIIEHGYHMDARAVAEVAPQHLWSSLQGLQLQHPFELETIDEFLFHQASLRLLEGISTATGIPMKKIPYNCNRYGNTAAASIGILLDEGIRSGRLSPGKHICLLGVGAGWQFGGVLVIL